MQQTAEDPEGVILRLNDKLRMLEQRYAILQARYAEMEVWWDHMCCTHIEARFQAEEELKVWRQRSKDRPNENPR
jgi:hypothetical protein